MDNIVQMDTIRIDRQKPRKCTCDQKNKKFTVDTENKEITCGCGLVVDAFDAMANLAKYYERINENHKSLYEQSQQWLKEKPYSVIFKGLEREYQRGEMLPGCPECGKTFDFKNIRSWTNAKFYRKLEEQART